METIAQLKDITKRFPSGDTEVIALDHVSLDIYRNELVLIIGPSGSGKTTLLLILGGIITPTSGEVFVRDKDLNLMDDRQRTDMRLRNIGFVFQNINLIKPLNVIENVSFAAKLLYKKREKAEKIASDCIESVGLGEKAKAFPEELSGGEQQRIAVARALATRPDLLLCDEPTASLDSASLKTVMHELRGSADEGKAVIVVSHDQRLEEYSDRIINVTDGKIKNE